MNEQPDNAWLDDAACKGMPTDWWYPQRGDNRSPIFKRAKQICAGCTVQRPCLDEVMGTEAARSRHGYWGGMSPNQREELFRQRRRRNAA